MGRKNNPTAIKLLAGNPGKRPLNNKEPKLVKGIGEPPLWLEENAVAEWWRIVPDLEKAGVTTRVEATMLAAYCQAVADLIAAREIIKAEGRVIEGVRGKMKHPATVIARESMTIMAKIGSEFGITPSSRSSVVANPHNEENEFASV